MTSDDGSPMLAGDMRRSAFRSNVWGPASRACSSKRSAGERRPLADSRRCRTAPKSPLERPPQAVGGDKPSEQIDGASRVLDELTGKVRLQARVLRHEGRMPKRERYGA